MHWIQETCISISGRRGLVIEYFQGEFGGSNTWYGVFKGLWNGCQIICDTMGGGLLWKGLLDDGKALDDLFGGVLELVKLKRMWDGNITTGSNEKVIFGIGLRFILFNLFETFIELIIFGNGTTAIP